MKELIREYITIKGRATRKEFWKFILFNSLLVIVLSVVSILTANIIFYLGTVTFGFSATALTIIATLFAIGVVGLFILTILTPLFCISVRRLHDIGKSAWWMLIALVPGIGVIILWIFFMLKSHSDNMYGPNPKRDKSNVDRNVTVERIHSEGEPIDRMSTRHRIEGESIDRMSTRHRIDGEPIDRMSTRHRIDDGPIDRMSTRHRVDGEPIDRMSTRHRVDGEAINSMSIRHQIDGDVYRENTNQQIHVEDSTSPEPKIEYAPFWRRFLAYVIDIILLGFIAIVISIVILVIGSSFLDTSYVDPMYIEVMGSVYL